MLNIDAESGVRRAAIPSTFRKASPREIPGQGRATTCTWERLKDPRDAHCRALRGNRFNGPKKQRSRKHRFSGAGCNNSKWAMTGRMMNAPRRGRPGPVAGNALVTGMRMERSWASCAVSPCNASSWRYGPVVNITNQSQRLISPKASQDSTPGGGAVLALLDSHGVRTGKCGPVLEPDPGLPPYCVTSL